VPFVGELGRGPSFIIDRTTPWLGPAPVLDRPKERWSSNELSARFSIAFECAPTWDSYHSLVEPRTVRLTFTGAKLSRVPNRLMDGVPPSAQVPLLL